MRFRRRRCAILRIFCVPKWSVLEDRKLYRRLKVIINSATSLQKSKAIKRTIIDVIGNFSDLFVYYEMICGKETQVITDRRSILAGFAIIAAVPGALAQTQKTPPAEITAAPMDFGMVKTAMDFYTAVLGPAELSLSTSQIAVSKAMYRDTLEFAGFELGEAITVNMVLKDIGAKAPVMGDEGRELVEKLKATEKGATLDRDYIGFQLKNHEFLRDLADGYLHNSAGAADPTEKQGRHLAMLMLAVFKEHTAICKRITSELKA